MTAKSGNTTGSNIQINLPDESVRLLANSLREESTDEIWQRSQVGIIRHYFPKIGGEIAGGDNRLAHSRERGLPQPA